MKYLTYKIDLETVDKIISFYQQYRQAATNPYIIFTAKTDNITITIYQSKKGYKAVFNGEDPEYEAKIFSLTDKVEKKDKKDKESKEYIDLSPQIGSDEVGFGDFFGPLVVASCYYDSTLEPYLSKIKDSKKLTDRQIITIIDEIKDKIIYSLLVVDNQKYNSLIENGYNMNKIKTYLHNKALFNLLKKIPKATERIYIDQFLEESTYYHYLKDEKDVVKNITFQTKGETYYPSIALASLLARYTFIKKMEQLDQIYQFHFPFGASLIVDEAIIEFINKYGQDQLVKVGKLNFNNYKKLTNL